METYKSILSSAAARLSVLDLRSANHLISLCIDHTSLNQADSESSITQFIASSRHLPLAAICVYPSMLESAGIALGESNTALCAVCGAFPSGQTYLEVKLLEVALAIENGADEIDIVIDLGAIIEGQFDRAQGEIRAIKEEIGDDALLKVIIESGVLKDNQLIYKASQVAMEAGADFVKTSTGKSDQGATFEAAVVICCAIKNFFEKSGKMVGIKISGGVSDYPTALVYYSIVQEVLGNQWLNPSLFRIGSSKLAMLPLDSQNHG